jgi:hypothetical protein
MLVNALELATFVQALDEGLDTDRDAVASVAITCAAR